MRKAAEQGHYEPCSSGVTCVRLRDPAELCVDICTYDPAHSAIETRYLGIGKTATGRHVLIAFTYRTIGGERFIRPISARFMHAKEIQHYEAQSKDSSESAPTEE